VPEGHTLHRLAATLTEHFAGERVEVSSPQGRFTESAALLDGTVLETAEAWGKHLFVRFEGGRFVHVHLGLYGRLDVHRGPAPAPVGQVRMRPGNTLRRGQFDAIWHDLVALMHEGVATGRIDTVRDEHTPEAMGRDPRKDDHGGEVYVYRRHDRPCHVCGSRVRTEVLATRNLFWCPRCQPRFRSRAGVP